MPNQICDSEITKITKITNPPFERCLGIYCKECKTIPVEGIGRYVGWCSKKDMPIYKMGFCPDLMWIKWRNNKGVFPNEVAVRVREYLQRHDSSHLKDYDHQTGRKITRERNEPGGDDTG